MTDEGKSPTEKWVADKKANYAYAYDKGGKLKRFFGITGIPSAVLVDPNGMVVWRGHPASLKNETIITAIEGALKKPLYDWSKDAKNVKKALAKRKFSKAIAEANKMGEGGADILESLNALVSGRMETLRNMQTEGDYLAVETMGKRFDKEFSGLPQADEVESILSDLKHDKGAQKILKAQKKIHSLINGKIKRKDRSKLIKHFRDIMSDFADTAAARDADRAITRLKS